MGLIGSKEKRNKQSDRERQIPCDTAYRWNLIKMVQKNLFEKQKQTDTFQNHCYGSHK